MRVPLSKICGGAALLAWLVPVLLLIGTKAQVQVRAQEPEPVPREQVARPRGRRTSNSLMHRLHLTPEQRERLREIRRQSEPEARELSRRVRLARRALDEAIYADVSDDALVAQRVRALSDAQAALLRLRAATELRVRRVLTSEQLQSFRELRQQAQRRQFMRRRPPEP